VQILVKFIDSQFDEAVQIPAANPASLPSRQGLK
jgi:hypothetical protein